MTDVWNAASAQQSAASNTQESQGSASANAGTPVTTPIGNMSNPFMNQQAASDAVGTGGTWDPRVPFDLIEGRMVILVPKSFRADAPIPEAFNPKPGETREEYRVDLVILEGKPFSFRYNFKASKDATPEEKAWEVKEFPSTHRGQTIAQGQLIRALKGAEKSGAFLYGVMTMVPQWRDRGLYPTPEALSEARAQWISALTAGQKGVAEPRYTWGLDDRPTALTPERINLAMQWWENEKQRRLSNGE